MLHSTFYSYEKHYFATIEATKQNVFTVYEEKYIFKLFILLNGMISYETTFSFSIFQRLLLGERHIFKMMIIYMYSGKHKPLH